MLVETKRGCIVVLFLLDSRLNCSMEFFQKVSVVQNEEAFRIFNKAELAYRTDMVGFFSLNCHTCLNGSIVNSCFNSCAPLIKEYIPTDEKLVEYRSNV